MASAAEKIEGSGSFKSSRGKVFGKLEQIFDDVWWAWGTTQFMPGMHIPRNMVIVREKGELVLIHPVVMPDPEQIKIDALGPVKHIVRLGAFHGMDDAKYVMRYSPSPKVWAPANDPHDGVAVDHELVPGGDSPIEGATIFSFARAKKAEMAMLLPRHGGFLLTADSMQNWENAPGLSLLAKIMVRPMGFKGRGCIGPAWRKECEPKDGEGFAPDFARLLDLDFKHGIGGHGRPMIATAKSDLRTQAEKVYPSLRKG
ncbi:MAG: hypothetical protein ACRELY_16885 [Polyangiaceae bacterium]